MLIEKLVYCGQYRGSTGVCERAGNEVILHVDDDKRSLFMNLAGELCMSVKMRQRRRELNQIGVRTGTEMTSETSARRL